MEWYLPVIWAALIGTAVAFYVILDGFDLGVGILFPTAKTESGRQPWIIQGILRTADALSPVPGAAVATSLALFVVVYGIVFSMGIYYINRLIVAGPGMSATGISEHGLPSRPLSAAEQATREALGQRS